MKCGFALCLAAGGAAAWPVTVPLAWVDKQAYVANVSIDGRVRSLQVGTEFATLWLACAASGGGCDATKCGWRVATETSQHCATLTNATLALGDDLTIADFPLRIAQYHELSDGSSSSGSVVSSPPDYSAEQPPLVTGAEGALGLGRGDETSRALVDSVHNFSVYLTTANAGAGSFVRLGGSEAFDTSLVIASGWSAQYSLPVRPFGAQEGVDALGWPLSLVGARFGDDKPLFPRVYAATEPAGGDAAAFLSLNDAVVAMPTEVLRRFQTAYLATCSPGRNTLRDRFFLCANAIMGTLPRIELYLDSKTFYLDPTDYTHVSSANASNLVVEIGESRSSAQWALGAPFLRKFPARFGLVTRSVDLFCRVGSSCRPQSGALDERVAVDAAATTPTPTSVGDASTATPWPTPRLATNKVSAAIMILWMGGLFTLMAFVASGANLYAMWRDDRRGYRREDLLAGSDDAKTVASERDLEELRRAQADDSDDSASDYSPAPSPRTR